jgi:hypothetical protein
LTKSSDADGFPASPGQYTTPDGDTWVGANAMWMRCGRYSHQRETVLSDEEEVTSVTMNCAKAECSAMQTQLDNAMQRLRVPQTIFRNRSQYIYLFKWILPSCENIDALLLIYPRISCQSPPSNDPPFLAATVAVLHLYKLRRWDVVYAKLIGSGSVA